MIEEAVPAIPSRLELVSPRRTWRRSVQLARRLATVAALEELDQLLPHDGQLEIKQAITFVTGRRKEVNLYRPRMELAWKLVLRCVNPSCAVETVPADGATGAQQWNELDILNRGPVQRTHLTQAQVKCMEEASEPVDSTRVDEGEDEAMRLLEVEPLLDEAFEDGHRVFVALGTQQQR